MALFASGAALISHAKGMGSDDFPGFEGIATKRHCQTMTPRTGRVEELPLCS